MSWGQEDVFSASLIHFMHSVALIEQCPGLRPGRNLTRTDPSRQFRLKTSILFQDSCGVGTQERLLNGGASNGVLEASPDAAPAASSTPIREDSSPFGSVQNACDASVV